MNLCPFCGKPTYKNGCCIQEVRRQRDDLRIGLEMILDAEDALSRAGLNGNTASQGEATIRYREALKGSRALLNR